MARKHVQIQDSEVEFPADVQLVSTTDLRGVITYANPAFCRIAGYHVDELVGTTTTWYATPTCPRPPSPTSGIASRRATPGVAW
jgi:aerotaxis receptor